MTLIYSRFQAKSISFLGASSLIPEALLRAWAYCKTRLGLLWRSKRCLKFFGDRLINFLFVFVLPLCHSDVSNDSVPIVRTPLPNGFLKVHKKVQEQRKTYWIFPLRGHQLQIDSFMTWHRHQCCLMSVSFLRSCLQSQISLDSQVYDSRAYRATWLSNRI